MENIDNVKMDNIRREWSSENNRWYFSIVDVISIITNSTDPRNYWKTLKNRLGKARNKLVTECNQLKMRAGDGKSYLTDVADKDVLLEIIELVSPAYVDSFEQYFNNLKLLAKPSYPQPTEESEEEMELLVDGYIKNNIITVEAFVAGIETENILVTLKCDSVTISGERKIGKNIQIPPERPGSIRSGRENYLTQELSWGKFSRTISLPQEVEINLAEANIFHGLLTIKLPLINKERSKILRVKNI